MSQQFRPSFRPLLTHTDLSSLPLRVYPAYFGHIVRDGGDATDCLTWDASTKELLDSDSCSFKDDQFQESNFFSFEEFGDNKGTTKVKFLGAANGTSLDFYFTLKDDGKILLNEGTPEEGVTPLYLSFPGSLD